LLIMLILLTSWLAWTFFTRLTLTYNEEGRYLDETTMTVYKQQAVWIYGLLTGIGIVLIALTFVVRKSKK
jgi:hypothetical protein